jgi:outer membrane protein assembly factor BamB
MRTARSADPPFVVELLDDDGAPRAVEVAPARSSGPAVLVTLAAAFVAAAVLGSAVWSRPPEPPRPPPIPDDFEFDGGLATRLGRCATGTFSPCLQWVGVSAGGTEQPVGVAAGLVITANDHRVRALEPATGRVRARSGAFDEIEAVAAGDGLVVVAERDIVPERLGLAVLDAATSEPRWQVTVTGGFGRPVIGSGVVVVDDRRTLLAFDAATAERRWEVALPSAVAAPPLATAGLVVLGTADGDVTALDAATGDVVWRTRLPSRLRHPAAALGDTLVVASASGLVGLDAATGDVRWDIDPTWPPGWLARSGDLVVVEMGAVMVGIDAAGEERWRTRLPAVPTGEAAADRVVYLVVNRSLVSLDAVTGDVSWDVPLLGSWPVSAPVAGEGVVVIEVDDEVVALG